VKKRSTSDTHDIDKNTAEEDEIHKLTYVTCSICKSSAWFSHEHALNDALNANPHVFEVCDVFLLLNAFLGFILNDNQF